MMNAIDNEGIEREEDILAVKRRYFTNACDTVIGKFVDTWFVKESELYSSAIHYVVGSKPIPNIGGIINSKEFDKYKEVHPDANPLKYGPEMKRQWRQALEEVVVQLNDELR